MKLSIPFFDAIVAKNANDLYFMGKFLLPQFLEKGSKVAQKNVVDVSSKFHHVLHGINQIGSSYGVLISSSKTHFWQNFYFHFTAQNVHRQLNFRMCWLAISGEIVGLVW